MSERGAATWRNWAGNQRCAPAAVDHPRDVDELAAAVKAATAAGQRVKVVGSGHSFTDIACTDGRQIVLDRFGAVLHADRDGQRVTVESGIVLGRLNAELDRLGLAMPNLGDIAYQTIAGAISTGTHGTGARLGGIATQVAALDLVLADGSVVSCSADENPDLFAAARVGLGALGAIATVTLQCVPAFDLHVVEEPMRLDAVLESFDAHADGNDHFEFYWVPHTGWALTKRNNRTDRPRAKRTRARELYDDIVLQNLAFGLVCRIGRRRPSLIPRLARALPSAGRVEYVDRSADVFVTPRWVRFYEMEYAIPREHAADAVRQVRSFVDRSGLRISFPVEVRVAAADDIWLSTASGRDTCYIAVHVFEGMQYEQYFRGVEGIMDDMGGRPHWGKLHYQTAASLARRYPHWDAFASVRNRLDPEGRFANPYLDRVLGTA